jgi:pimeloyl-ACP methyl ester carboxylesterase
MLVRVEVPPVRYVPRRGKKLAYTSNGKGPRTLVVFLEIPAHLDLLWADPVYARQAAALAESCRVVRLQRLGVGLSDAIDRVPTLEEQASDIAAVMDAEGISSAVLFGMGFSAMPVVLLAAQAPERVQVLVLLDPHAQGVAERGL